MIAKILPTVIILISAASAAVYAYEGDWRKTAYWAAAAVLNIAVTY